MPILGGQSKTVGESTHIGALTLVFMGFLLSCNRNMNMYLGRFSSVRRKVLFVGGGQHS